MALSLQYEAFVSGIVAGMTREDAYKSAGYKVTSARSACVLAQRLLQRDEIKDAIQRGKDERARNRAEATKIAIEHSGITQARVAVELGRIGFANMGDYVELLEAEDNLTAIVRGLPREATAALTEVWIDAQGHVRFKLGDKRAALMDVAKLFGWIVEKRENKIVDEFDSMTAEQIEAWLDERAEARVKIRQRRLAHGGPHSRRSRRERPAPSEGGIGRTSREDVG